jgi:hypothetical protein
MARLNCPATVKRRRKLARVVPVDSPDDDTACDSKSILFDYEAAMARLATARHDA